jgi:hypothetical protein
MFIPPELLAFLAAQDLARLARVSRATRRALLADAPACRRLACMRQARSRMVELGAGPAPAPAKQIAILQLVAALIRRAG